MKNNYLLTDFNSTRWNNINLDIVKDEINILNKKREGVLYGQIGNPREFDIQLSNASHLIDNITLINGKVYGDVEFLDNKNGKAGYDLIENKNYIFGIRSVGSVLADEIIIDQIFTWDIINNK